MTIKLIITNVFLLISYLSQNPTSISFTVEFFLKARITGKFPGHRNYQSVFLLQCLDGGQVIMKITNKAKVQFALRDGMHPVNSFTHLFQNEAWEISAHKSHLTGLSRTNFKFVF